MFSVVPGDYKQSPLNYLLLLSRTWRQDTFLNLKVEGLPDEVTAVGIDAKNWLRFLQGIYNDSRMYFWRVSKRKGWDCKIQVQECVNLCQKHVLLHPVSCCPTDNTMMSLVVCILFCLQPCQGFDSPLTVVLKKDNQPNSSIYNKIKFCRQTSGAQPNFYIFKKIAP